MRNEKGVTVVELLAAITILLIISSLIYGVLIDANNNYKMISQKSNLEQEANLIISTIKTYHQNQDIYYLRCNNFKAYIGSTTPASIQLGGSDLNVTLKIDNDANYTANAPNFPAGTTPIESSRPIYVYLKLENTQGQTYEIDTVIKRY